MSSAVADFKDKYGFSTTVLGRLIGAPGYRVREVLRTGELNDDEYGAFEALKGFCARRSHRFNVSYKTREGHVTDLGRDPAAWFETPITEGCPLTPTDIWVTGRRDLCAKLCRLTAKEDKEAFLDDYEPDWRKKYASEWEVYEAEDGEMSLRLKRGEG